MNGVFSPRDGSPALAWPNGCERAAEPPCAAQTACCGSCMYFRVLDDMPRDEGRWFGVCLHEAREELGFECMPTAALDFVYSHGRHGCNMPVAEDCYEEA